MLPSPTAETAARARVDDLLSRLARVDLQVVIVRQPDATRLAAEGVARDAATSAGRADLFDEAVAATREAVLRLFARSGFSGTWALTEMAVSVTRADDRVAAATAFEEAAMAAVVEDLVDDETLDVLRATADNLLDMTGLSSPGSLSNLAASGPTGSGVLLRGAMVIAIVLLVILGLLGARGSH